MIETRHPDVYVIERPAVPVIVGVGTTSGAFIGYSERGPIDKADLVTSFSQFIDKYGSYFKGSPLPHAVEGFFDEGGSRAYIVRVVGTGYAKSEKDFKNQSPESVAASISGSVDLSSGTFDLSIKKYLNVDVNNGGPAPVGIDLTSTAGDPAAVTGAEIISAIEAVIPGVATLGVGGVLTLTAGAPGTEIEIQPAAEAPVVATFTGSGFDGTSLNAGNKDIILNIDGLGDVTVDLSAVAGFPGAVAVADVVTAINTALDAAPGYGGPAGPYAAAASVDTGEVKIDGVVTGPTGSIVIKDGPAGTGARLEVFGLPEGTGDYTTSGSTVDAVTIVTGFAEGSTYTVTGTTAVADLMKIYAINPGEWGDRLSVTTQKWETTSTAILPTTGTSVFVSSLRNIRVGDVVRIFDGTTEIFRHIYEVDSSTKELKFSDAHSGAPIAAGAKVHSSSSHRFVTELTTAISIGDTTAKLLSSAGVTEGVRIIVDDKGTNAVSSIVVKKVNGSNIIFDPATTAADIGAVVSSVHFDLLVKEEGQVVEDFQFLSPEETDVKDFFEKRLSGDANESKKIGAEFLLPIVTDLLLSNPFPVVDVPLEGGLDGVTPTPLDFLGTEEPKSGMYLLEDNDEFVMFSMPGISDIFVIREAIAFAERSGRVMFITETPLSDDEPLEAQEFREIELAIDSSYGALYYPWLKVRDPESDNPEALITIPPSGHVQGLWSKVARNIGVHKAPAGVADGNLSTVYNLTYNISDGEQDILNEKGINAIRFFRGQGFKVWGARTLWRQIDGFHYLTTRRLVNFVKESIKRGNRFAVFAINDEALWRTLTRINEEFLNSLWQRGMLFPSSDASQAYFFVCNEATNPRSEIKRGRVNSRVGISPQYPAEFVIFTVGLYDGGEDIVELFS